MFAGKGSIIFSGKTMLGYNPSPFFFNGIIYLEVRQEEARIVFGNNIFVNNNFVAICEKTEINIGDNVLIGSNVEIIDSDFHEIHPKRRNSGKHVAKPVRIGKNVFIGSNVKIMKGVQVGENCVIANGAVLFDAFPPNVIIGGNPAVVLKSIVM